MINYYILATLILVSIGGIEQTYALILPASDPVSVTVIDPVISLEILEVTEDFAVIQWGVENLNINSQYDMHISVFDYLIYNELFEHNETLPMESSIPPTMLVAQFSEKLEYDKSYRVYLMVGVYPYSETYGTFIDFIIPTTSPEEPSIQIIDEPATLPIDTPKKGNGGCNDCTPPTLGLDKNMMRVVDNGFSYNGNKIQVEYYHTPYPLINTTVGELNKVEIIAYENNGINNMKMIQFGLGAKEIGEPLNSLEVLIEVHLLTDGTSTGIQIDEIVINDKENLIDNDSVSGGVSAIQCQAGDVNKNCIIVYLEYSYRESTINNIMLVNAVDKRHNAQSFYFNDGVQVLGDSINIPPTHIISNKHTSQQKDNLTLTLTRIDKVNDIWIDDSSSKNKWHKNDSDTFTQLEFSEFVRHVDTPITSMDRMHSNFADVIQLEKNKAIMIFDSTKIQSFD